MMFDPEKYKKIGLFKLSSVDESSFYYDIKEAMGEYENLNSILLKIGHQISNDTQIIIGLELGGIPIAVGLCMMLKIPFAVLRKEKNDHGTEKKIEGFQKIGKAVIVDDVETTGKSLRDAEEYLKSKGYEILQVITVVKR